MNIAAYMDIEPVIFIPGNVEHQIKTSEKSPLIFLCLVPRGVPEL